MPNFLFLLLVLACPLMMIFMMRGMSGGRDTGAGHGAASQGDQPPVADVDADQRIADLERQVAELRAERDRTGGPASRP